MCISVKGIRVVLSDEDVGLEIYVCFGVFGGVDRGDIVFGNSLYCLCCSLVKFSLYFLKYFFFENMFLYGFVGEFMDILNFFVLVMGSIDEVGVVGVSVKEGKLSV